MSNAKNFCKEPYFFLYMHADLGFAMSSHDDVIKCTHFPRYWPFVRGIHRSSVNSTHKGQWRGALMFSLICVWINGWVNNREAGDLGWYRVHYDISVMCWGCFRSLYSQRGPTLAQVIPCCLTAPSHYQNQCWLIISKVQWQWSQYNVTWDTSGIRY